MYINVKHIKHVNRAVHTNSSLVPIMRITKLFSNLRLDKIDNLAVENVKRCRLVFFSQVWLYVIRSNNFTIKFSNPMTFSNLMYHEK